MKKLAYVLIIGSILFNPIFALAEQHAVKVNIGGTGGPVDSAAIHKIRKFIGSAFTKGVVDTLYVYSPRVGGPILREGGLSLCVEGGFNAKSEAFDAFISKLRSIHPRPGTFYNIELAKACDPIALPQPLACGGIQGKQCANTQQYCDFGVGQCKMPDAEGTCKDKPTACTDQYVPVCGCDGKTYGNACDAASAGVSVDYQGKCNTSEPQACGGIAGIKCPSSQVCVDDPADTCDPTRGGADCPGICKVK